MALASELKSINTGNWVWLPVPPDGLSTQYQQNWGEAAVGAGQAMGGQILSKVLSPATGTDSTGGQGDKNVGAIKVEGVEQVKGVGGQLLKNVLGTAGVTGRIMEQAFISYSGPGYRQHSFSFSMRPKDEVDSKVIEQIINFFKWYSAPELMNVTNLARIYTVPHIFQVKLVPDDGLYAHKPAALTSVDVKYGGEKYNIFKDTKMPVAIDLTLSFQEMQLFSKKDFVNPLARPAQTMAPETG